MRFILFVGSGNTLAGPEISVRIPGSSQVSEFVYSFDAGDKEEAIKLASSLGSSLKIAEELETKDTGAKNLSSLITQKEFSITDLNELSRSYDLCEAVKDILGKVRFVVPKNEFGLSPVIIVKNKIDELLVDQKDKKIYRTVWVHDFEHWIKKDREMPFVNAKAGMLPPKIARSMVNLIPGDTQGKLLVDPFCGSGRILVEASELGYRVAGLDASASQVSDSQANLKHLGIEGEIFVYDATHLSKKFTDIDAIVTEPFLGKPNLRPDQVDYAVKGLEKLYLGCLKDWHKALKSGGYIIMVFPILTGARKEYHTSRIIDSVKNLSYNLLARVVYSRPEAGIKREIITLQK